MRHLVCLRVIDAVTQMIMQTPSSADFQSKKTRLLHLSPWDTCLPFFYKLQTVFDKTPFFDFSGTGGTERTLLVATDVPPVSEEDAKAARKIWL